MDEYFLTAEIKAVYGSDGFVSIISYSDFSERFFHLNKVYIDVFNDKKLFIVEDVKQVDNNFFIKFKNFNSASDVGFLIGKKIFVSKEDSVKLDENTFFVHDLIGCSVFLNSQLFGRLVDVLELPANDVYVIKDGNNKEAMIAAVRDNILSFDAANKKLDLKPGCLILYNDEN